MFRFKCYPDGGQPFEVDALSRAIAAWENAPGQPKGETRRSVSTFSKNLSMTDSTDLAWYAASRAGLTGLDLVEWRKQVDVSLEKFEDEDDEIPRGEAGPTSAAP